MAGLSQHLPLGECPSPSGMGDGDGVCMGFYPRVCCLAPPSSAPILVLSNVGTSGSRALTDTKLDGMREGSQHSSWHT